MDDDETADLVDDDGWVEGIERAVLSDTVEGRAIAAAFIPAFGDFMSGTVRPLLREVATTGGEPQLLVNGLAQMLRDVADSIELPVGARPRAHPPGVDDAGAPGTS